MISYQNYISYQKLVFGEENFFVLPWGSVVMKNCDVDGEFLMFKSIKNYKYQVKSLWLLLKLHFFRDQGRIRYKLEHLYYA